MFDKIKFLTTDMIKRLQFGALARRRLCLRRVKSKRPRLQLQIRTYKK